MKTTTFVFLLKCTSVVSLCTLASAILAGPILSPTSIYNNTIGTFQFGGGEATNMIDQSGLATGFTSGVTDFDTYMAGDPTHLRSDFEGWIGPVDGPFTGVLDFDLGNTYTVENFALWNTAASSTANVQSFTLFLSSLSDFSVATDLGTFNNPQLDAFDPYPATIFDTPDAAGRYLRLQVNSHHGNAVVVEIGEVAVEVAAAAVPLPEPGSFALFGLALAGFTASKKGKHRISQ